MRYAVFYLLYAAVVIRAVAFHYYDDPVPPIVYGLMACYGIVLAVEAWLGRRWPGFIWIYLFVQTVLVTGMLLAIPEMDFLPSLFYPLCFQAVLQLGRRTGFAWIVALVLIFSPLVLIGWEWQIEGIATVLLDGAACFFVGSYAHLIQRAERARESNQQLLIEVQEAYRRLQDHAAQVEEYAILQERNRMARELHDSVTQTIFSMNLTVQAARMLVEKDLARAAHELDRLGELARSAIGEIQVLVDQLRPRALIADGLPSALRHLIDERYRREGLHVDLQVIGDRQLPQPVAIGLYRIVQEALNNITKHAATQEAWVCLNLVGEPAYLEVEDRGRGFNPEGAARDLHHIGLAGMADRARELGWKLDIESQPGRGTRIRIEEAGNGEP